MTLGLYQDSIARLRHDVARLSPPFGALELPREGQTVDPGVWAFGWALDDSGIAEVRLETELGPAGRALYSMRYPGLGAGFPDYADAEHGGFTFPMSSFAPGAHRLTLTFVANDGGQTKLSRSFRVAEAASASPVPGRPEQ